MLLEKQKILIWVNRMKNKIKIYSMLNISLIIYSLSSVFSKLASNYDVFSFNFVIYYGLVILCLGIYAIVWQQVIKRLPLITAFATKAITIVWGIVWGVIIFSEQITLGKIIGAVIIIIGVIMYAFSSEGEKNE